MTKRPSKLEKSGYVYVGTWQDGQIGWNIAPYCYPNQTQKQARRYVSLPHGPSVAGERVYLCRIKIKPVLDKRGRFIVRKATP